MTSPRTPKQPKLAPLVAETPSSADDIVLDVEEEGLVMSIMARTPELEGLEDADMTEEDMAYLREKYITPSLCEELRGLAHRRLQAKEYSAAADSATKSFVMDGNAWAALLLAEINAQYGDLPQARKMLTDAKKRYPGQDDCWQAEVQRVQQIIKLPALAK